MSCRRAVCVKQIALFAPSISIHVKSANKTAPELRFFVKLRNAGQRTWYVVLCWFSRFRIEKVMPKVKPDTNAAEILAYLKGDK